MAGSDKARDLDWVYHSNSAEFLAQIDNTGILYDPPYEREEKKTITSKFSVPIPYGSDTGESRDRTDRILTKTFADFVNRDLARVVAVYNSRKATCLHEFVYRFELPDPCSRDVLRRSYFQFLDCFYEFCTRRFICSIDAPPSEIKFHRDNGSILSTVIIELKIHCHGHSPKAFKPKAFSLDQWVEFKTFRDFILGVNENGNTNRNTNNES